MGKNEKTPITVNDTEYFVDDMTDAQKTMLNHVNDLERKLARTREEMAKEYVTKDEVRTDMSRVIDRLEALDAKLDRLMERSVK
jgi:hypothetical protein